MQAKYVITRTGKFVIGNESLGLMHPQLSEIFLDGTKEDSAGFIYIDEDTKGFCVYGRSTGLGLSSNPFAAGDITEAFRHGSMWLIPVGEDGVDFVASNVERDGAELVTDLEQLRERRIITD